MKISVHYTMLGMKILIKINKFLKYLLFQKKMNYLKVWFFSKIQLIFFFKNQIYKNLKLTSNKLQNNNTVKINQLKNKIRIYLIK